MANKIDYSAWTLALDLTLFKYNTLRCICKQFFLVPIENNCTEHVSLIQTYTVQTIFVLDYHYVIQALMCYYSILISLILLREILYGIIKQNKKDKINSNHIYSNASTICILVVDMHEIPIL